MAHSQYIHLLWDSSRILDAHAANVRVANCMVYSSVQPLCRFLDTQTSDARVLGVDILPESCGICNSGCDFVEFCRN